MQVVSQQRCFGGVQGVYQHTSAVTGTEMQFAVYTPPQAQQQPVPVVWYLSGLTCTPENVITKSGVQRYLAEHGMMLVAPDTSPRGAGIAGEQESYDFGVGAGFYVDATEPPWNRHYRMYRYIVVELADLINREFPADRDRQGITGHSMGGHGALTIGLKHPDQFQSISAFSPICAATQCDWGRKALRGYLGDDPESWRQYDATELIGQGRRSGEILIDQGEADEFLEPQLQPQLFAAACRDAEQALQLRMQPGYDHSYFFIASFIGEHIAFHARALHAGRSPA